MQRWLLGLWLLLGLTSASGLTFSTYCNERFGFCLEYPDSLLMQPPPDNGDGRIFKSKDGRVELRAYGSLNALSTTLRQEYLKASASSPTRKVTYRLLKTDSFVVSGLEGGKVFYQKTFWRSDVFTTMQITYPPSLKSQYDPVVSRIVRSFKPGP